MYKASYVNDELARLSRQEQEPKETARHSAEAEQEADGS